LRLLELLVLYALVGFVAYFLQVCIGNASPNAGSFVRSLRAFSSSWHTRVLSFVIYASAMLDAL